MANTWQSNTEVPAASYFCGYCGNGIASAVGFPHLTDNLRVIRICPFCDKPTYFHHEERTPAPVPGKPVEHLPEKIETLFNEARRCAGQGCFTAAVLVYRKMLMNIGVAEGAKENLSFIKYVEYLADKGFVPPNGKAWVDHIREKGNEANHEIVLMSAEDTETLTAFVEMLLRFIYEFPNRIPPKVSPGTA